MLNQRVCGGRGQQGQNSILKMAEDKHSELIDNKKICYRVYGSGPANLLLLHGAVGSYQDFYLQMSGSESEPLDPAQFTVVAPDLPGCGRSEVFDEEERQNCLPTLKYFEMCAETCMKLMAKLGFKTYSVAGWNDGARIGALLAIKFQSRVDALILWGFSPIMDKSSCLAVARARDVSSWEPEVLANYSRVYGEQNFSDMWRRYVDFTVQSLEEPEEEMFDIRARLSSIKCPTLILHGSSDPIISYRNHVEPMEAQIYDSHIERFAGLAHNLHQADATRFNRALANFVTANAVIVGA